MQSTKTQPSAPNEVLSLIISKLATNSREDVSSCVLTCPELAIAANDYQVFRTMNLQDIVAEPLLDVTTYLELMVKCLLHSNPSAQYITGFLKYFRNNNPVQAMLHLRQAAHAEEPIGEAVYLYGIIKMCTREFEVGKTYLVSLGSHADDFKSKQCWKSIKKAMHGIIHVERAEYAPYMFAMLPPYECNLYDMKNSCP